MRLVQKAAEKHLIPHNRYHDQYCGGHNVGFHQSREGFEEAPWMGHGGVRHMDPGHVGQCSFSFCINCHAQLVILPFVVGGKAVHNRQLLLPSPLCHNSSSTETFASYSICMCVAANVAVFMFTH